MRVSSPARWAGCAFVTGLLAVSLWSQTQPPVPAPFIRLNPEEIKFGQGSNPNQAMLVGDLNKPGMYVFRQRFAPGQIGRPHFHNADRYVTVIKGTWWVSLGPESDAGNPDTMVPMKAGSMIFHPAGHHHFDGAKDEEVIVQIIGYGPVTTTQLQPAGAKPAAGSGAGAGPAAR